MMPQTLPSTSRPPGPGSFRERLRPVKTLSGQLQDTLKRPAREIAGDILKSKQHLARPG